MNIIPSIIVPIIDDGESYDRNLSNFLENKKVVIFGVPGAFTPTCSEQHLPGFIRFSDQIKNNGIDEIFCLSVNDKFVMKSWFLNYPDGNKVKGIADGNAEVSKALDVTIDKSSNFMGLRCKRFSMIINNNNITKIFFEDDNNFYKTSAENIIKNLT